jgi:hypothetical protein
MDNEVMQIGPLQLIGLTFDYLIHRELLSLLRQMGNTSLHKLFSQYGCNNFKRNITMSHTISFFSHKNIQTRNRIMH